MRKSTSGFTIVELLIVVVVIAILAVISMVAYSNLQIRANNSKTLSAVAGYIKALNTYKAENDQHPPVSGSGSCLGNAYGATGCDSNGSYTVNRGSLNTTYLSPYFQSSVPSPATNLGELTTGRQFGGAVYVWNSAMYGGTNNGGIGLYHQGGGNCPDVGGITLRSSDAYVDGSGRWCRYSMN